MSFSYDSLSSEQRNFVDKALAGYNILVDACIGSGKTTAIQALCDLLPQNRNILYLTYNKLLKLDAQAKLTNRNVLVQNYHGFACRELYRNGRRANPQDCLQAYVSAGIVSTGYSVLILDEYQDIEKDIADMLVRIKASNPGMQIVAVGDMAQKIYDKTSLDVKAFISDFVGPCYRLEFTRCFRLNASHAAMLGRIWQKEIVGVNKDCQVLYMTPRQVFDYVSQCEPGHVLCLGANQGRRVWLLNELESKFPEKFNKRTVWSKISEAEGGTTMPGPGTGIFTTYDGCKGMERDVCVLFDWTEDYWDVRLGKPLTRYEILRNVFCVAASRGKRVIIFCESGRDMPLDEKTLSHDPGTNLNLSDMEMSTMFDFKLAEQIDDAYRQLDVREVMPVSGAIDVRRADCLIDLSPCIGIYQEVAYFKNTDIDVYIKRYFEAHPDNKGMLMPGWEKWVLDAKVLYYTALVTGQNRYLYQVESFITPDEWSQIRTRLSTVLSPDDVSQVGCKLDFYEGSKFMFTAAGFCDVLKDGIVYELKFVSDLSHVHAMQLAMYLVSMDIAVGRLWNVRTNQMLEVRVPDRQAFLDKVAIAVTKGLLTKYSDGHVSSGRAVTQPANRKAFGYQTRAVEFVGENLRTCYVLMLDMMDSIALGLDFKASKVEAYFRAKGIGMPMSGRTFLKYFGDALLANMDSFNKSQTMDVNVFVSKYLKRKVE